MSTTTEQQTPQPLAGERGTARVEEVTVHVVRIPFERPMLTAGFPIPGIDSVLVELRTGDGATGLGWSFGFGEPRAQVLRAMVLDLAPLAIGADVFAVEALWQRMRRAVGFTGAAGIAALAMSAIDTACWDAMGRVAGLPAHRLLGSSRDAVEAYASSGLWLDRDRDELAREARELVDRGFRAVKMRAGLADADEDVARVAAVREAIGPDAVLMVDANMAWDASRAIRMAHRFAEHDVFWLEEPVRHDDVAGMARVRAASPVAICTGESNWFKEELRTLLEAQAADYVMPDLMRMGGVTEFMKAAHLCEAFDVPVTPHLFMEVSAHLAAACPNAVWQEHQPWWEPVLAEPVAVVNGEIRLSDRPGFGVDLDPAAVARYAVGPAERVR